MQSWIGLLAVCCISLLLQLSEAFVTQLQPVLITSSLSSSVLGGGRESCSNPLLPSTHYSTLSLFFSSSSSSAATIASRYLGGSTKTSLSFPFSSRRGTSSRQRLTAAIEKSTSWQEKEELVPLPEGPVENFVYDVINDPKAKTVLLNIMVVSAFVGFAVYKLGTVDMELSRGWTWYEILLRMPTDNFFRYESSVGDHPIITKAFTSCTAYGIGDFLAQCLQGNNLQTVDLKRTARSALAGLCVHGPLCHYWIEFMARYLDFNGAWWNFVPKVIADQTVWSLFLNAAYTTFAYGLQGYQPKEIYKEVTDTCWPALSSSWRFWPLIHCVSFNDVIPKDLKLLFIDLMEIIWVTILSTVANKDNEVTMTEEEVTI